MAARRATANRYALGAVAITSALQLLAVAFEPLRRILGTVRLAATEWIVALLLAAIPALVGQGWKMWEGRRRSTAEE